MRNARNVIVKLILNISHREFITENSCYAGNLIYNSQVLYSLEQIQFYSKAFNFLSFNAKEFNYSAFVRRYRWHLRPKK